jgi:hypothetical protein
MKTAPTFPGKPCKRNHVVTIRYVSNGHCVACSALRRQMPREKRRDYMRTYRATRKRLRLDPS